MILENRSGGNEIELGEKSKKGCSNKQILAASNWSSVLLGNLRGTRWNASQTRLLGRLFSYSHTLWVEVCPWGVSSSAAWSVPVPRGATFGRGGAERAPARAGVRLATVPVTMVVVWSQEPRGGAVAHCHPQTASTISSACYSSTSVSKTSAMDLGHTVKLGPAHMLLVFNGPSLSGC